MKRIDLTQAEEHIPMGIGCIDSLLNGGLEKGVITEVFGEGGSGKTNFAMHFAVSCLNSGKNVIYIDSEGFSSERFLQISGGNREILQRMYLYRVLSVEDQEISIMKSQKMMEKEGNFSMVIIDSFTEHFRAERDEKSNRPPSMQKQLSILGTMAAEHDIPVLITNQIYMDVDKGNFQAYGGYFLNHSVKTILSIEKLSPGKRVLKVVKHRSIQEELSCEFYLLNIGIACNP
ncbi:MAG: DNA repair and recombination protein RadB [Thermoplasmataceae archaeon]